MSDLQGRELDRAIAEAMGGARAKPGWYWFRETGGADGFPDIDAPGQEPLFCDSPDNQFHSSLDALRDGPERMLREAGWSVTVILGGKVGGPERWSVVWASDSFDGEATAATEAEARARACLTALRAMKEARLREVEEERDRLRDDALARIDAALMEANFDAPYYMGLRRARLAVERAFELPAASRPVPATRDPRLDPIGPSPQQHMDAVRAAAEATAEQLQEEWKAATPREEQD